MARFKKRSQISAEMVGESSISDVAFLLLVFFIVTTTFPEVGLPLILPSASSDVRQIKRENVMQIVTARSGVHFIDLEETPTDLPRIKEIVTQRLSENKNLILSLETHSEAPYQNMIEALDMIMVVYEELEETGIKREKRISLKMLGLE
ncbi:biopolymer transporter ExbD [bacterium]|nr:biopolymer transporter ExbD [bacterium]